MILMGKSDPDNADRHRQQSMILVPTDTPGVDVIRPLPVFNFYGMPDRASEVAVHRCPGAGHEHAAGGGARVRDRPGPPRAGPDPPLHAADRTGRTRARDDVSTHATPSDVRPPGRGAGRDARAHRRVAHRHRADPAADPEDGALDGHGRQQGSPARDRDDQDRRANMACKVVDWAIQAFGGAGTNNDYGLAAMYATAACSGSPTVRTKSTATSSPTSNCGDMPPTAPIETAQPLRADLAVEHAAVGERGALELAAARAVPGRCRPGRSSRPTFARVDAVNPAPQRRRPPARRRGTRAAADAADRTIAGGDRRRRRCTACRSPSRRTSTSPARRRPRRSSALADAVAGDRRARRRADARAPGRSRSAAPNLPDLGLRVHTDSSLHGLTRNPWNPDVTAGGSSGGEAAALASGMSPLGLRQRHRRLAAQPGALLRDRLDQADAPASSPARRPIPPDRPARCPAS